MKPNIKSAAGNKPHRQFWKPKNGVLVGNDVMREGSEFDARADAGAVNLCGELRSAPKTAIAGERTLRTQWPLTGSGLKPNSVSSPPTEKHLPAPRRITLSMPESITPKSRATTLPCTKLRAALQQAAGERLHRQGRRRRDALDCPQRLDKTHGSERRMLDDGYDAL